MCGGRPPTSAPPFGPCQGPGRLAGHLARDSRGEIRGGGATVRNRAVQGQQGLQPPGHGPGRPVSWDSGPPRSWYGSCALLARTRSTVSSPGHPTRSSRFSGPDAEARSFRRRGSGGVGTSRRPGQAFWKSPTGEQGLSREGSWSRETLRSRPLRGTLGAVGSELGGGFVGQLERGTCVRAWASRGIRQAGLGSTKPNRNGWQRAPRACASTHARVLGSSDIHGAARELGKPLSRGRSWERDRW